MALYNDGSSAAALDHVRGAVPAQNAVDGFVIEVMSGSLLRLGVLHLLSSKSTSYSGSAVARGNVGFVVDEAS